MEQILALLIAKAGNENGVGNQSNNKNKNRNKDNDFNQKRKVLVTPNLWNNRYSWSHGINPTHDSCLCNNKFPCYQNATIYTNQMDGWQIKTPR